jgi:hypothetical protein
VVPRDRARAGPQILRREGIRENRLVGALTLRQSLALAGALRQGTDELDAGGGVMCAARDIGEHGPPRRGRRGRLPADPGAAPDRAAARPGGAHRQPGARGRAFLLLVAFCELVLHPDVNSNEVRASCARHSGVARVDEGTTFMAGSTFVSAFWQPFAAAWMLRQGRVGEWACS